MIRSILVALFLLIYLIVSLPIQLVELIIRRFNPDFSNKTSLAFVRFGLRVVTLISGVKLKVDGEENIPDDRAALFVANHCGFFDIVVTYPLTKRLTGYVAKKEIKKVPILSWWMYFTNCIFLDRQDPRNGLKAVLAAADLAKNGISVFLFPEGTRSKDGKLHEFKEGGMKIATKSGCPIIPVGITGTADVLENHFPIIKPAKVTVSFGKPIETEGLSRAEQRELASLVHSEVAALISK